MRIKSAIIFLYNTKKLYIFVFLNIFQKQVSDFLANQFIIWRTLNMFLYIFLWFLKLLISRNSWSLEIKLQLLIHYLLFFTIDTSMCICQRYVINTSTWSFKWPQASEAWRVWQDVNSGDTCITCLVIIDLWLRILLPNL